MVIFTLVFCKFAFLKFFTIDADYIRMQIGKPKRTIHKNVENKKQGYTIAAKICLCMYPLSLFLCCFFRCEEKTIISQEDASPAKGLRLICCQLWLCLPVLELELWQLWLRLCIINVELLSTFTTSVVLTYTGTGLSPTLVVLIYSKSGALPTSVAPILLDLEF